MTSSAPDCTVVPLAAVPSAPSLSKISDSPLDTVTALVKRLADPPAKVREPVPLNKIETPVFVVAANTPERML